MGLNVSAAQAVWLCQERHGVRGLIRADTHCPIIRRPWPTRKTLLPKKLLSCSFCFFGSPRTADFYFWILQFGEINVSSQPFNSWAESELDYNPSAPLFIIAARRKHWKAPPQRGKHGWNRVTYIEQIFIISSWEYAVSAFSSSADLLLTKLLLWRVKSTHQQLPMPNASNNAQAVLHCLTHTWTDIDGDFAHTHTYTQHLLLYLVPINPTVTLETCTFLTAISIYQCFISLSLHKQPFGFAACEVFLLFFLPACLK